MTDEKQVPKIANAVGPMERPDIVLALRANLLGNEDQAEVTRHDALLLQAAAAIEQYRILIADYMTDLDAAKLWRGPLRWDKMTDQDVCVYSFELAGALRQRGKFNQAKSLQKIADDLYNGKIKPAPIHPRTTIG